MPAEYSYQTVLNDSRGVMLTFVPPGVVRATPLPEGLPASPPSSIRQSITEARRWFSTMQAFVGTMDAGKPDSPFTLSIKTEGSSGRVTLDYKCGQAERRAVFDPQSGNIITSPSPGFEASVWSWWKMHDAYLMLCDIAESKNTAKTMTESVQATGHPPHALRRREMPRAAFKDGILVPTGTRIHEEVSAP